MRLLQWIGLSCLLLLTSCSHHSAHYLGYVEGRYVYLSSAVSGNLIQLAVHKGETVQANQVAFQLDPQPELSQLNTAKAQLTQAQQELENIKSGERSTIIARLEAQISQAQANVIFSKKMFERNGELVKTGAVGKAVFDESRARFEADQQKLNEAQANLREARLGGRTNLIAAQAARVEAAKYQVEQYEWMLAQKTVKIPVDGFVQDTLFRQNEFVPAGKPVISFLPPDNRILIFFVPENILSRLKLGAEISFTCDGCKKNIPATINYISSQAEYTPPVIYSENTRDKLVYWIEAKIDPSVVKSMHPGEPVQVSITHLTQKTE
jgi:HlyD family secretion protein